MSFTTNSKVFAEAEISGLQGEAGLGFHRLTVRLKINIHPKPQAEQVLLIDLGGELSVELPGGIRKSIGRLDPRGGLPLQNREYVWSTEIRLDIEMEPRRIEALEEVRAGGGLGLSIYLNGMALDHNGYHQVSDNLSYRVNQGTWIEILGQLGFARIMLLEVPVPDDVINPALAKAVKHLQQAHGQMLSGHDREAVGCCRDAIEAIQVALGDSTASAFPANKRDWDKHHRLRALRQTLIEVCHPARHADEVSARFEWNRDDSLSMISMVAGLIRWIEKIQHP